MANKIFQLLGEIIINYNDGKIEQATKDAQELKNKLEGVKTQAGEAGDALENTGGTSSMGEKSSLGKSAVWFGNMLTHITYQALDLGKKLLSAGMEYNAAMEGYEVNFGTLLQGDSDRAKQLIKDLEQLALETPLDMRQTSKAAQDLLIYGTAIDDVLPTLRMMGDVTFGNTERMSRFALAVNQMKGKGKLMAQEQNQMTEAGVPIIGILEKYLEDFHPDILLRAPFEKLREDGVFTAEMVMEALFYATQEGQQFYGAMTRSMETYEGQTQKTAEIGTKTAGKLFEPFFEVYKSDVLPQLAQTLENIYNWAEANQDTLRGFAESLGKIANFALSPNWDSFMDATLTTWNNTIKPTLEKALTLVIGIDIQFPTAGSIQDDFTDWIMGAVPDLPEAVKNTFRIGDKTFSELYDEYSKALQSGLGVGSADKKSGTDWGNVQVVDVTPKPTGGGGTSSGTGVSGSRSGTTPQKPARSLDYFQFWSYDHGVMQSGDYLSQAIAQMNSQNSDSASQMISLLSAILAATNRPIVLNTGALVGGMGPMINSNLGRVYAQSTRR